MRNGIIFPLVLPVLLATCASSTPEQRGGPEKHRARTIAALVKKADSDSLAAAALLGVGELSDNSLELLSRAVAVAPDRPDLVWVNAQFCYKRRACDPEPLEGRLRALDGANGVAWLGALARADFLGDESAKAAALTAISQSARVDIYWTTLIARLSSAAAQTGVISLREAEVSIIGVLAAQAIPAYGIVSKSCKGERLQHSEVLEACRGIAKAFEAGDTYITEMIGITIAKRVWPEQSSEWLAATEAKRVYEYRATLLQSIDSKPWNEQAARNYLALCVENHREQDVFRAQLIAAGKQPDPPGE